MKISFLETSSLDERTFEGQKFLDHDELTSDIAYKDETFKLGAYQMFEIIGDSNHIGYIILKKPVKEIEYSFKLIEDLAHIRHIFIVIHPDFRNKGFGSAALSNFLKTDYAKSAQIITADINKKNDHSKKLFTKVGFKKAGPDLMYNEENFYYITR